MRLFSILGCVVGAVLLCSATAAAFSYDEGVGGDLDSSGALRVFEFELGQNSISGTRSLATTAPSDDDLFGFTIPTETEIRSVRFDFEILAVEGFIEYLDIHSEVATVAEDGNWAEIHSATSTIYSSVGPVAVSPVTLDFVRRLSAPANAATASLPLTGGPFAWIPTLTAVSDLEAAAISWSYVYSFELVPIGSTVPEPASAVLIGFGLLALGIMRPRAA